MTKLATISEISEISEINEIRGTLEKLGRADEALAAYDEAIKISPKQDELYNNKGVLLGKLERHSEALVCFMKSVELTKDYQNDDKDLSYRNKQRDNCSFFYW